MLVNVATAYPVAVASQTERVPLAANQDIKNQVFVKRVRIKNSHLHLFYFTF